MFPTTKGEIPQNVTKKTSGNGKSNTTFPATPAPQHFIPRCRTRAQPEEDKHAMDTALRHGCPTLFDHYPQELFSPYPFAIPAHQEQQLRSAVGGAGHTALRAAVQAWIDGDVDVRRILSLGDKFSGALERLQRRRAWVYRRRGTGRPLPVGLPHALEHSYKLGAWRPDFLFDASDGCRPKICEINARFAFNAYFSTAAVTDAMEKLRQQNESETGAKSFLRAAPCIPVLDTADIPQAFTAQFAQLPAGAVIGVVKGEEKGFDVHLFVAALRAVRRQVNRGEEGGEGSDVDDDCGVVFVAPSDLVVRHTDVECGAAGEPCRAACFETSGAASHWCTQLVQGSTGRILDALALELHQHELEALSDAVLDAVADRAILNPLESVLLVHDKRMLAILSDAALVERLAGCGRHLAETLARHVIPTRVVGDARADIVSGTCGEARTWLLKPNLLGKGAGFIFGPECADADAWDAAVAQAPDVWIVQPIIDQPYFDIAAPVSCRPRSTTSAEESDAATTATLLPRRSRVVGLLPCLHDACFGFGIFRASNNLASSIVNVSRGGAAILPPAVATAPWHVELVAGGPSGGGEGDLNEEEEEEGEQHPSWVAGVGDREPFLSALPPWVLHDGVGSTLSSGGDMMIHNPEQIDAIRASLDATGIAVIRDFHPPSEDAAAGVEGSNATSHDDARANAQLTSFVQHFGEPLGHDSANKIVWDVRPSGETKARSHNAEIFPMHTDCSFELPPPKYFALWVIQQDAHGGGISHLMPTQQLQRHLSHETLRILRTTDFTVTVPTEFVRDSVEINKSAALMSSTENDSSSSRFCTGPILSAEGRWRYRSDIVVRDSLTPPQLAALAELDAALGDSRFHVATRLPQHALLLIDNTTWFHARGKILDKTRWLKRIRFHAFDDAPLLWDFERLDSGGTPLLSPPPKSSTTSSALPPPPLTSATPVTPALCRVVAAARVHPWYAAHAPPVAGPDPRAWLAAMPVLQKTELHTRVAALFHQPDDNEDRNETSIRETTTEEESEQGEGGDNTFCGIYWSPSGGTSGAAGYMPCDVAENAGARVLMADALRTHGVFGNRTICANLFGGNLMYRSLEILGDYIVRCRGTNLPLGHAASDADTVAAMKRFRANTIAAPPTRLAQLAAYLVRTKDTLPLVRRVVFASEPLQRPQLLLLRQAFSRDIECCSVYGGAEVGVWAFSPPDLDRDCYRLAAGLVHIEIVNPDADGFGRIVATPLTRRRFPVVRFDTGDIGRLEVEPLSSSTTGCGGGNSGQARSGSAPYTRTASDPPGLLLQSNTSSLLMQRTGSDTAASTSIPGIVLRVQGRDGKRSFTFATEYYETNDILSECPTLKSDAVLAWQIVIKLTDEDATDAMEVLVVLAPNATTASSETKNADADGEACDCPALKNFRTEFRNSIERDVDAGYTYNYIIRVVSHSELHRSATGNKIPMVVDLR